MAVPTEAIHRQVNPRFIDQGIVAASAFAAREDEDYKLSMTRSSIISAQDAIEQFTKSFGLRSAGAAEILVGEVNQRGSRCVDDSSDPVHQLPVGHCYVDYRGLTKQERRILRVSLAEIASSRGVIPPR